MDLPTCPSCQQSVLDDDATECPFCGAPMSGAPAKQGASPSGQSSAGAAAQPKQKPQASGKSGGTQPAQKAPDEDPLAAEAESAKQAIPLRPKPTKGRSHKIVCPMCETPGYASSKVSGKEVRCANPECMVPVFTAPEIQPKQSQPAEEPEPEPSGLSAGTLTGIIVVLLLAAGGGTWFFFLRPSGEAGPEKTGTQTARNDATPDASVTPDDDSAETGDQETPEQAEDDDGGEPVEQQPTLAERRQQWLQAMIEASRERENNRSKPFCRSLTADAFASAGDLQNARAQLDHLRELAPNQSFYQILPLVTVAWRELQSGETETAGKAVDRAVTAAERLPQFGRASIDRATALATVLAGVGRSSEARSLLADFRNSDARGQLSARLRIAYETRTFDLDDVRVNPLRSWKAPQDVAVTYGLTAHQHWKAAQKWAQSAPDETARIECLAAWASDFAAQPDSDKQAIESAAESLSAAGRARVLAHAARSLASDSGNSQARTFLDAARSALETVEIPSPLAIGGMQEIYEFELPDRSPLRTAALAAAEIAQVEAQLGETETARASLQKALAFARAMAPSPAATGQRVQAIETQDGIVRSRLQTTLNIPSVDEARRAFAKYRRQCRALHEAAGRRFELQTALLTHAIEWGLADSVHEEIQSRAGESDPNRREPYMKTTLPWVLADHYEDAGAADKARALKETLPGETPVRGAYEMLKRTTAGQVFVGSLGKAARALSPDGASTPEEKSRRRGWVMQLACRLVGRGKTQQALAFVDEFRNPILREDAFGLVTARAARRGDLAPAVEFLEDQVLPASERVAFYRGLVLGSVVFSETHEHASETADAGGDVKAERSSSS